MGEGGGPITQTYFARTINTWYKANKREGGKIVQQGEKETGDIYSYFRKEKERPQRKGAPSEQR